MVAKFQPVYSYLNIKIQTSTVFDAGTPSQFKSRLKTLFCLVKHTILDSLLLSSWLCCVIKSAGTEGTSHTILIQHSFKLTEWHLC